jgi:hypothetical protein
MAGDPDLVLNKAISAVACVPGATNRRYAAGPLARPEQGSPCVRYSVLELRRESFSSAEIGVSGCVYRRPFANKLTIQILAAVAEHDREAI